MSTQLKASEGLGDCRVRFSANETSDPLLWTTVQAIEAVGCSRAAAVKKMMMLGWMALQGVDVRSIATQMLCEAKIPDFEQIAGYPLLSVDKPNFKSPTHQRDPVSAPSVAQIISEQSTERAVPPQDFAPVSSDGGSELLFNIGNMGTLV